tara:strand:+ start:569 stop:2269 length:1701 start_codon:yes stop_codon:yes gene_type:complete
MMVPSDPNCILGICFAALDPASPKIFGFSEFLAGLALMVLAWTISDFRYRFRVRVTAIPLMGLTFSVVASIGILTLLTDIWRAEGYWVPEGNILTPVIWQGFLGGVFVLTFLGWVWYAFIKPSKYGKRNALRYARALYRTILKGDPVELRIVADELSLSAKELIEQATDYRNRRFVSKDANKSKEKPKPEVEAYANDLLLLIADKRFARAIVDSSPGTALLIFEAILESGKFGVNIEIFGRNLVEEAFQNPDSFLFHEAEGYQSGLLGYHRPLSQALFSNHDLVEEIGTLLDTDYEKRRNWNGDQWKAYTRIVLMTFDSYVDTGSWQHSFVLYRAKGNIERALMDLYRIDGSTTSGWEDPEQAKLRVVVEYIKSAVEILERKGVPDHLQIRIRDERKYETIYDQLAGMIFETIFAVSAVRSPSNLCWWLQHNSVWGELFNFQSLGGSAGKVVKFKVRRLIYNEIVRMKKFPNFKGAKILGFCLNVMGLEFRKQDCFQDSNALHKALLSWTVRNYQWLHAQNKRVAEACLVENYTYDEDNQRLVKIYPEEGLRTKAGFEYLDLDPVV